MYVTTRFEKVTWSASKRVPCAVCGKRVVRQTTLYQTLSPFNRSKLTGLPKSAQQITAELIVEAEEWKKLPAVHGRCES